VRRPRFIEGAPGAVKRLGPPRRRASLPAP